MTAVARRPLLTLAFAAFLCGACGQSVGEGSKRLVVEAPKWWFQLLPVPVAAKPAGALAGRAAGLTVAVGSNVAGRWETKGTPITIRIPANYFTVGTNRVSVKTGTERSAVDVQIVSFFWLATPALLVGLIVAYFVAALRRRRARS